jgi:hypothetical protein
LRNGIDRCSHPWMPPNKSNVKGVEIISKLIN